MDNFTSIITCLLGTLLFSCASPETNRAPANANRGTPINVTYATQFEVWQKDKIIEVTINSGSGGHQKTYALVPSGSPVTNDLGADQIIQVPVTKMVITSTSHIPFLDLLGSSEYLTGFPNTRYISSVSIRKRIEQGLVEEVGSVNGLNFESLITLQPELVVTYASGAVRTELDQLDQSGVPYVLMQDFMEETPLGRAEWIKFMGLLTGQYDQADSVFDAIEKNYMKLLALADSIVEKPTVFSGILYGDTWFAPGANSFAAKYIDHAGGLYSWNELSGSGSVELSLEAVIDRNIDTQFWIGVGEFSSRAALASADSRYTHFNAFKSDRVYNYHGKIGPTGGFEYFELGGARPDLVLSDLIKILHPDLLPDYQPYFYKKLD